MMSLIEKGDIHPVIADKFTLENISDAHLVAEQRGKIGKIIVTTKL